MSMGNAHDVFEYPANQPTEVQLLHAAEFGKVEKLRNIIKQFRENKDFNIDVTKNSLWTPLFMAAKQGHADCVSLLLDAGAHVDGINENKAAWTPLWVATYSGHQKCVDLLIQKGARLEAKHPETPLFVAAREGKIACLQLLIKSGANLNVADKFKRMPIHMAALENCVGVAKELVSAGCKIDVEDSQGCTPLLLSCIYADENLMELLLKAGADHSKRLSSTVFDKYTPLHICASKSRKDCIKVLWKYGANFYAITGDGFFPQEIAPADSCREIIIKLQGTVRDLKDICRLKIRNLNPHSVLNDIGKTADIPEDLVLYLNYQDGYL